MTKVRNATRKSPKAHKAKAVKKSSKKTAAKSGESRRLLSDVKIAKLQKLYKSNKYSAQHLCDEFGISMATLFNYLKVKV